MISLYLLPSTRSSKDKVDSAVSASPKKWNAITDDQVIVGIKEVDVDPEQLKRQFGCPPSQAERARTFGIERAPRHGGKAFMPTRGKLMPMKPNAGGGEEPRDA